MSGRDESHGKSAVRRYRQKKYLVHSHIMLKHRSVAYTIEQPSVYLRPLTNEYISTKNVARYVYGVDTQLRKQARQSRLM